ncbi:MAG: hypothetical protein IH598_08555 [Bacteroidales bacterium]|nr:hypothetical protein [Bacteroidales bacterium]
MKKDKLEQFIISNRDKFDEFEPDPALFERIRKPKPVIPMFSWNNVLWKAAAVLVIFVASYYFHDYMSPRQPIPQTAEATSEQPSEMIQMMIEAEAFYTAQIDDRRRELNLLAQDQPEIQLEINYELVELDSIYADLKRDLKDNASNEEVIEAMIQNYRIKLDILEDVLSQMRSARNEETETNQTNDVNL